MIYSSDFINFQPFELKVSLRVFIRNKYEHYALNINKSCPHSIIQAKNKEHN